MNRTYFLLVLMSALTSINCSAKNSIKLFHDNEFPVVQFKAELEERRLTEGYELEMLNIDEKKNATTQLNQTVRQIVEAKSNPEDPNFSAKDSYSEGFNELINNRQKWTPIYKSLESGAKTLSYLIQFNIKKTPAFLFNDKDIVYGELSLQEAEAIYLASRGDSE